ncbi:MAG: SWF/SNF helicase family protein, partial [Chloroflexi bacterium]|nr:SWF/SNF helicase family protein [Chloroflexota bacterium]
RSTVEPVEQLVEGADIDESDETTTEREVYRTRPQVTITLLNGQGEIADMSGDAALVDFIGRHKSALLEYLDQHFKPLYDFRYDHLAPLLNRVRIKGNPLYQTQRHVIAATYTALQHRKGVIVVGEPGVGKTALGAALAIALRPHMKPDQVVLVMSPPHLTGKWQREIEMVARSVGTRVYAPVLKHVNDVRAFMDADLPLTLKVGIIPREMAKLGEGWQPAVQWRTVRTARWGQYEARPDNLSGDRIVSIKVPICPSCSATVTRTKNGEAIIADEKWLSRAPQKCPSCGSPLWQFSRTFSAPKPGEKYPKRNPRMPLAEYIATVFPHRVYLYLCDEVHEAKSTSTDQGAAMMKLAQTAEKVVGLTGTLYGGTASSLYGLEFTFNPRVRRNYPWGVKGQAGWVRDMGALERIVEYRPEYDKGGHYTGKRRIEQKPKEAPGCSPLLVREIIDHTVFVGLQDIGRNMPDFEEIPVPIPMDADMALHYNRAKDKLGTYLFQCWMEGDASFLGRYLQTLLAWPTAPFRGEKVIHKRRFDRESDVFLEIPVHDMPGLADDRLYPKEQWLVDLIRDELAQDRNVGVFLRQTGTRDIQPRIEHIIREHVPGARPFVLKGSVAPERRESLVQQQLEAGINVLVCNPRLVQTGLDLVAFPTLVFLEPDYSLFVMGQASRRAWRIIQDQPCKTYYPHYIDTMEHQAVELIGRKQQAANLLYGDTGAGGLSELTGANGGGGDLLAELAKAIDQDESVTDLRDLFARHAQQADPAESAWFVAEPEPAYATEGEDDLVRFGVEELGGVLVEVAESTELDEKPRPAALPSRKKARRRKVSIFDVPASDELIPVPRWPVRPPEPEPVEQPEFRQLALF